MSAQTKRRLPLTVLTVLLSGLLAATAVRLLLPSLLAEQPPQGYLTTTVTVDGLPADPPQPLLYADRETIYVNLQRLAPLVEGLTLERGEEAGEAVLRLSHRRYACRAVLTESGLLRLFGEGTEPLELRLLHLPLFVGGDWLISAEAASLAVCALLEWQQEEGRLEILSLETAMAETAALAAAHGLTAPTEAPPAARRLLLTDVFPAAGEGGVLLFSRRDGPLFDPVEGQFTRTRGGYLLHSGGLLGLYSPEGIALLQPEYTDLTFLPGAGGLLISTDPAGLQRLWMVSDGGILPLTPQSCRAVGHGHTAGGADGPPALLDDRHIAVQAADGGWGVYDTEQGRLVVEQAFEAVGGFMDVGAFPYQEQGREAVLTGLQPTCTLWYEAEGERGLVVRQNGLWGVASLRGELLWEPRYNAIFAVPFGEQPGWYGLRDGSYERLATLDAGQRPVLDTAAQLALSGAELILLSRDATGHLTADTATGTAYLLPPAVGETLFETAPLYTLRRVTERREALAVADVPLPPYVLCPVTEIGIDEERAVRTYPEQLLSRLVGGEGPLALEEFTILDLDISETGDVYHRLALTLEVTPCRRPGSDSGTLWGEPEEDGRCRLTLGMTLYRAEQEGRRWLCAAAPDGVPFEGLPEPAAWEPPVWRYQARQLQNRYEQMMAGEAEERVFYETESITLLEERRLEPDEEGRAYRYRVTVVRLDGEERESLFDMPYAMGDITVRAVTDQGLLVTTWRSLYASSGFEGSFGLLTAEGFAPMLEKATCLGEGPDAIYLIGQRNDVRGIYVMNTVTGLLRLLCPLPGAPFSPQLHSARLLLADPARLLLAWPTGGDEAYEIFSVTLPRGETTRLWPQP